MTDIVKRLLAEADQIDDLRRKRHFGHSLGEPLPREAAAVIVGLRQALAHRGVFRDMGGLTSEAVSRTLRDHWLVAIECDHVAKTDRPVCACSQWRCHPRPSVGAAVDAWINHVLAVSWHLVREDRHRRLNTRAARDVIAERKRQMEVEHWSHKHDDEEHAGGELAAAAACYALFSVPRYCVSSIVFRFWPWSFAWWKPKDPRADLVRAGALILAEIERLDRLAAAQAKGAAE